MTDNPYRAILFARGRVIGWFRRSKTADDQVKALAKVLGDFAIADEHSGQRNDEQLARRLVERGVVVKRAKSR